MSTNSKALETLHVNLTEKIKSTMDQHYSTNPQNAALTCKQIAKIIQEKAKVTLSTQEYKILTENVSKRIFALLKSKKVTRTTTRPYHYSIAYKSSKFIPVPNIDDLSTNLTIRHIEKNNQPIANLNPCKHIQLLSTTLTNDQIQDTINYLTSRLYVSKEEHNKVVEENKSLKIELHDLKQQWKTRVEPLVKLIEQAAKL